MRRQLLFTAAFPAILLLSACGGGGGGGGGPGGGITTPAPPSTPVTPPSNPSPTTTTPPSASSGEYTKNWALAAVNAHAAFNHPASGNGITVAVIDTGVNASNPDLVGRVSAKSTDIRTSRNAPTGVDDHGTNVSTVIAARFDGRGTVGIAYEATILGIRADDGCGGQDGCMFYSGDLARAIDYAINNGAHIINMSLGGDTPETSQFEAALQRAKNAGVVVVASSGNDGEANPGWPARYAVDPRFAGLVVAVGASNQAGAMASFSNRAGVAANGYIVAPGQSVVGGCDGTYCYGLSGTSFSSPQVAGAIALLLQGFPNLTGKQAVEILLRTATDKGAPGVDSIWGHGLMNMANAFAPVGELSVPTAQGASVQVTGAQEPGAMTSQAFGDAIVASGALNTVGFDDYQRKFAVDLSEAFPRSRTALVATAPATQEASVEASVAKGAKLSLQAEAPLYPDEQLSAPMLDFVRGEAPRSVLATAEVGKFRFSAWGGQGAVSRPQTDGMRDAFRMVASPGHTISAGYKFGDWTVSAEQGGGERREVMTLREVDGASYVSATAQWSRGATTVAFTTGSLEEPQGPLGSDIRVGSTFSMPADTDFASVGVQRQVAGLTLRGEAGFGRTNIEQGLFGLDSALSTQWRVSAFGECAFAGCSRFGVELEQPLRLEQGSFTTTLADQPLRYLDPLTFSTRTFDAAPSGRQMNLRASWERDLRSGGTLRLRGVAAVDEGHRNTNEVGVGAAIDWRTRF